MAVSSDTADGEERFRRFLLTTGKSLETARTYSASVRIYLRWCGEHEIDAACADRSAVEHFVADQLGNVSRTTTRNRLFAVRCFYAYLGSRDQGHGDPTDGIHIKRPRNLPKSPVSISDQRRLAFGAHSTRDEAIVMMLVDTGVRIGELTAMRVENIRWEDSCVLIDGKGAKQREVWPGPDTMALLRMVVGERRRGPVWLTKEGKPLTRDRARKNFYRLAARSRVNAYPHKLRATFANSFLSGGGDLGALREAMGHSDIQTTAFYAAATEKDRARETVRRLDLAGRLLRE